MKIIPDIPKVYEHFPTNYINDINGWGFDKKTIIENEGKLLTLDLDYGANCSLNCPTCFRKKNSVDEKKHELKIDDLMDIIIQAKALGLRSVKFLGAGDPFENVGFLKFLKFLKVQGIIPLIFTKGHIIGDDELIKKLFEEEGITNGNELVSFLNDCNTSIMLGFNSFDDEMQGKLVGGNKYHIHQRNRALELLVREGFSDSIPTRLALAVNPITIWNVDEAFEIYKWARERNLYAIVTPTMISGRAKDKTWMKITPCEKKLLKLYTDIYNFNIETNLQTIEQVLTEGISSYAGGHPCNQVSTGLYITLHGQVLSCPGSEENLEGNIWTNSLKEIWLHSENRRRSGTFNCRCIAKDRKSIPKGLYDDTLKQILYNYKYKREEVRYA
jgi:hypothetical protein